MAAVVPTGTVTFLFTDVEGSTAQWETNPAAMGEAMRRHDQIVRGAIDDHGGYVFATGGDSFAAAFARIGDAVDAAASAQKALAGEAWPAELEVRVRMGVHTGEAEERDGDYFGSAVNRAARVSDAGHGGQVLLSDVTASLIDGRAVIDLGEHLLKSLDAPIGLRQLVIEGMPTEFPSLRTVGTARSTIRPPRNELVGRRALVERTLRELAEHRLVSLTGAGGAGKTRLALEVGNALVGSVQGGVFFVDLSKITDEALIYPTLAEGLGLALSGSTSAIDAVSRQLASHDALVVIDNCEHLIDDVADVVDDLLAASTRSRFLTTSREALGLDGEVVLRLPGMADDEALTLFSRSAGRDETAWSADEVATIGEVCRRLDGLPLAIELAAARTSVLSVADIAANLDDRFALLTGGRRRTRGRAQTLLATVQWSYDLLEPDEQAALAALSVIPGSFGLELAAGVLEASPVAAASMLDDLAARSLIQANPDAVDPHLRFRLLETIRVFAADQLRASGDEEAVRNRHLRTIVDLVTSDEHPLATAASVEQLRLGDDALVAYDWARRNDDVAAGCAIAQTVIDTLMFRGAYEQSDEVLAWVTTVDDPDRAAWMWAMGAFQGLWRLDAELIGRCAASGIAVSPTSLGAYTCRVLRAAGLAFVDPVRSLAEVESTLPYFDDLDLGDTKIGPQARFTPRWGHYAALLWADKTDEAVAAAERLRELALEDRFWSQMARSDLLAALILAGSTERLAEVLALPRGEDHLATAVAAGYSSRSIEGAALAHLDQVAQGRRHIAEQWADRPDEVVPTSDTDVAVALAECALVDGEQEVAATLLDACGGFARCQGPTVLMMRRRADLAGVAPADRVDWWGQEVLRCFTRDLDVERGPIVKTAVDAELTRLGLR